MPAFYPLLQVIRCEIATTKSLTKATTTTTAATTTSTTSNTTVTTATKEKNKTFISSLVLFVYCKLTCVHVCITEHNHDTT